MSTENQHLNIRPISTKDYREFVAQYPHTSFLQMPEWASVKPQWQPEQLGWFDADDALVAVALVLHRALPALKKTLAYIPDGPIWDWDAHRAPAVLEPLREHLKEQGAFLVRMGPPVIQKRFPADQIRKALSQDTGGDMTGLDAEAPTHTAEEQIAEEELLATQLTAQLKAMGWEEPTVSDDFEAGQPQFQARIPLRNADGDPLTLDEIYSRMDSSSRRQTRKSARTGVIVSVGTEDDFDQWMSLFDETAERDGFLGRPKEYFTTMHRELNAANSGSCVLYLAHAAAENDENAPEGTLLAAAIYIQEGRNAWYLYGASASDFRKLYAPRRLQLAMIEHALEAGCDTYDLGGVSGTLSKDHELAGLTRFKTTMGADVVRTMGEWDLRLNKVLARMFDMYMARRG